MSDSEATIERLCSTIRTVRVEAIRRISAAIRSPITIAVAQRMTADEVAGSITVYPSLSGTIAEVARLLHSQGRHR